MKATKLVKKSDLTPAFQAARDAGFDRVSVSFQTPDGTRFLITAQTAQDAATIELSPYDVWKAGCAS